MVPNLHPKSTEAKIQFETRLVLARILKGALLPLRGVPSSMHHG